MKKAFYEYPNINAGTGAELRLEAIATYGEDYGENYGDLPVKLTHKGHKMEVPLRDLGCILGGERMDHIRNEIDKQFNKVWLKLEFKDVVIENRHLRTPTADTADILEAIERAQEQLLEMHEMISMASPGVALAIPNGGIMIAQKKNADKVNEVFPEANPSRA